jgi:serine/threonine protein kinase SCH9
MAVILCSDAVKVAPDEGRHRTGRVRWQVKEAKASAVVCSTPNCLEISSEGGEAGCGDSEKSNFDNIRTHPIAPPLPPHLRPHYSYPSPSLRRPPQRQPHLRFTTALLRQCDKMLKFWPSTPADLTPRADPNGRERPNPFDQLPPLSPSAISTPPIVTASTTNRTGPFTPTAGILPQYHHQLLNTPHHLLSPSISAANGSDLPSPHLNPHPPPMPLTPGSASSFAAPTTSLSLHAPEFNMQQPPPPKRTYTSSKLAQQKSPAEQSNSSTTNEQQQQPTTGKPQPSGIAKSASGSSSSSTNGSASSASSTQSTANGTAGPSKGQIHVKLIQARGLNVRSSRARPYVVVQFEQNEFISRDPTEETDKEVKGLPTTLSRNSSSNAVSALGAINDKVNAKTNGRQSTSSSGRGSKENTPSSSLNKSGVGPLAAGMFSSRIQAHNPVWKHEVSL